MKTALTGPQLKEAGQNWAGYPEEDLYRWIRNSQRMIEEKHPRALELWKAWSPTVMVPNEDLTDEDIDALLVYIDRT